MKLENQVCTKEQGEKLLKLGVVKKSLFYWHSSSVTPIFGEKYVTATGTTYKKVQACNDKKGSFCAFTVAELGVMLPDESHTFRINDKWFSDSLSTTDIPGGGNYQSEAQERADLLIYILDSKLVDVEEINQRLQNP